MTGGTIKGDMKQTITSSKVTGETERLPNLNIFNCPADTHFFFFLLLLLFLLFFLLILLVLLFLSFFVSKITCEWFQNCDAYTALNGWSL